MFGELADLTVAGIELARGNEIEALLSTLSALVPVIGDVFCKGAKLAWRAGKWVDWPELINALRTAAKNSGLADDIAANANKIIDKLSDALRNKGVDLSFAGTAGAAGAGAGGARKKLDDLLGGATKGKVGKTKQLSKKGGVDQANKDFDELVDGLTVTDHGAGIRSATLPDGSTVSVRPGSSQGDPTIQINPPTGKAIKVRYGN